MNILLVEPDYRSKFPPLGLMRISSFHKERGDKVEFIRGRSLEHKKIFFDRIYISSLFTYELPRTVKTINFYKKSVNNPEKDIIVGGIGATLIPEYIINNSECRVITGCLDKKNCLGFGEEPIAKKTPDYGIIEKYKDRYLPSNAYFARVTIGCIRNCKFCAVPKLEPKFGYFQDLAQQIENVNINFGEKKDLIVLDNNILAIEKIEKIISIISDLGFYKDSKFQNKKRYLDINQGIDARLITTKIAKLLNKTCLYPVRLALDHVSIKSKYIHAVEQLSDNGFDYFTTYIMFNFNDSPVDFYERLRINLDLSINNNIKITGFPMRYTPTDDISRHYISKNWNWRFIRGIQCILNASHGMVSPNPNFFDIAFGKNYDEFIEIISMPDDYILYRNKYMDKALEWKKDFRKLSNIEKEELYYYLGQNHKSVKKYFHLNKKIDKILQHYYLLGFKN